VTQEGQSRLKVGIDVPWVTAWTAEDLVGAAPCPDEGGTLAVVQAERPGFGRPVYSANHYGRQRSSARQMLCPMCGKLTQIQDRWTVTAKLVTLGKLRAKGLGYALPRDLPDKRVVLDAGAIAPLHRSCAEASLERCPHLRENPDVKLRRFPRSWVAFPLFAEIDQSKTGALDELPPIMTFIQLCGLNPQ